MLTDRYVGVVICLIEFCCLIVGWLFAAWGCCLWSWVYMLVMFGVLRSEFDCVVATAVWVFWLICAFVCVVFDFGVDCCVVLLIVLCFCFVVLLFALLLVCGLCYFVFSDGFAADFGVVLG